MNFSNPIGWLGKLPTLLDAVLEQDCPLCQRSTPTTLCQACQHQLRQCQQPQPDRRWQPPLPLFAWGYYGDSLKRALAALKYDRQPRVAALLGQWLAEAWLAAPIAAALPPKVAIVPVPLHPDKQRQRGYNQAELIAKAFCDRSRLPLLAQGLVRSRSTEALFGLTASDRQAVLLNAFQLGSGWQNRPGVSVLLLDDIYTTGTTAQACAQLLRRHQIQVKGILAVAQAGAAGDRSPVPVHRR